MKEIVNDGFAKVVKPYMDAQDKKSREIIAPVEVSPAEAPHSVGDQIIYNGLLYDVTAPIEVEDSLETSGAGANISPADNIEAQIKATKSQIQAAAAQAAAQNKKTQKMLAPVEEDETDASRAYVIGEQLILDGILYNVIDPIAQHGIITAEGAGANIEEADDVTTQLSSLTNKAYLTDDAAITEVASDDLLPIYDTSATAKKKIAVSNFIGGLVSNRNLLDNPFFTVNSRGKSSYTSAWEYTFDRWQMAQLDSVSISNDVVTIVRSTQASNYFLQQLLSNEYVDLLDGKTLTLSVMLSDNTILSVTGTYRKAGGWSVISKLDTNHHIWFHVSAGTSGSEECRVRIAPYPENNTVAIKAVKLELGTVSTLAMDTEPNYAIESAKCRASTADSTDTFANQGQINVGTPNPNLLDNPWFTVNQRGVDKEVSITTTTIRYWWDRWLCNINRTFIYNTDNSITSSDIDIWQIIEDGIEKLQGKTITLSLMLADGTIKSGSYDVPQGVPSTDQFISVFNNDGINIVFGRHSNGNAQFSVILGQNKTIKALKLELGSVSTLAQDTAPNYAEELMKCERYFMRIGGTSGFGHGIAGYGLSASSARCILWKGINTSFATISGVSNLSDFKLIYDGKMVDVTNMSIVATDKDFVNILVDVAETDLQYKPCYLRVNAAFAYMDISADL